MSEDRTRNFSDVNSFEERVLNQLSAINTRFDKMEARFDARFSRLEEHVEQVDKRLVALEDKVDRRLQETRPIWEGVQAQLAAMQEQLTAIQSQQDNLEIKLDRLNDRVDALVIELFDMREDYKTLKKRVFKLEEVRPTQ